MEKPLFVLDQKQLNDLQSNFPETGVGFSVVKEGFSEFYAVLSDGATLPLQDSHSYYDLNDMLAGSPIPKNRNTGFITISGSMNSRAKAIAELASLKIISSYTGVAGALPLVGAAVLTSDTMLYRYIQSSVDPRFVNGILSAGTYLTTQLELSYSNSGLAAVGRFALPLPLPACHVVQYVLHAGADLQIGTVAPLFGQSGGGVEVCLKTAQSAVRVGAFTIPSY